MARKSCPRASTDSNPWRTASAFASACDFTVTPIMKVTRFVVKRRDGGCANETSPMVSRCRGQGAVLDEGATLHGLDYQVTSSLAGHAFA